MNPEKPILLDGGMGRELKRVGAPFRQPEWSALALIEAPETVVEVHRRFVAAGCDIITTNNYAVVPFHLGDARFELEGEALSELAARLARRTHGARQATVVVVHRRRCTRQRRAIALG